MRRASLESRQKKNLARAQRITGKLENIKDEMKHLFFNTNFLFCFLDSRDITVIRHEKHGHMRIYVHVTHLFLYTLFIIMNSR